MNYSKGFAPILLVIIIALVLSGGYYLQKESGTPAAVPQTEAMPPGESSRLSDTESQILTAVNNALAGSPIAGYQPIPKGSKLLSAKVAINGSAVTVTLDFNRAVTADGEAAQEDTMKLVQNTVYTIVQGQGTNPQYSGGMNYVTLIEGKNPY